MSKLKFVFILLGFIIVFQYFVSICCNEGIYAGYICGQTSNVLYERLDKKIFSKNIKNLYSGSINIIEKYLTIYMILFIFSYYIRGKWIRRQIEN